MRHPVASLVACGILALAFAAPSPPPVQQTLLVEGQRQPLLSNRTVSPALFAELEELSRIVDISYCVGSLGVGIQPPFTCPSRCTEFSNFELVTSWNTGAMLSDSCGYIALSHAPSPKRIIVAFRGTYSITNTIADLSTMPQEFVPYPGEEEPGRLVDAPRCTNCTVHTGFHRSWQDTRKVIMPHVLAAREKHPDYEIKLVGHSLGGAVAAFAGLEMLAQGWEPVVTTFGEPRIGNQAMADYLDLRFNLTSNLTLNINPDVQTYRRVTHISDPIPLLPLQEWGYRPHGGEIFISRSELPPSIADVHHCSGAVDSDCVGGPVDDPDKNFWSIPARFRLWELFFAHRDYFWRLGLCVPTLDVFWPKGSVEL